MDINEVSKMSLGERLDLLTGLSSEEKQKAATKFLASLNMVEDAEFKKIVDLLEKNKIVITAARDIKVVANGYDNLAKKISIMDEVHEVGVYQENPGRLNISEILKVYQRLNRCRQTGIPYKKADGTYEHFLFDEFAWTKLINGKTENISQEQPAIFTPVEDDIITLEPEFDLSSLEDTIIDYVPETSSSVSATPVDNEHIDIQDYIANPVAEPEEEQAKTTDFAAIREELNEQLKSLGDLKEAANFGEEIAFGDLDLDSFGGRAV